MSNKYYYECPKCGGDDFDVGSMEFDDDYAWRTGLCNSCGFEWQEVYNFDHNEASDGSCNELDNEGNVK